ncbi:hypothetical protein CAL26_19760 [Bordetella genomosp. 9]|uniref:DUF4396 domain-containing protein n=2 Tax=Bordetella genomosp. 9 TaxID=1416803 RepID=A0A261R451_9BORD|nr:hypothetical protein CAL26_19760 [Bordetella genomosp. 9]
MTPQALHYAALAYIALCLASTACVLADIYLLGRRQRMKVMEAVWPLTMLYWGPIGMFAWMALRTALYPDLQPTQASYWFMMQIAMIVGFATTYPVNWWLIRRGTKERM